MDLDWKGHKSKVMPCLKENKPSKEAIKETGCFLL